MRPAVFIDRDGTLIELVHYLSDPEDVRLVDGAPRALRMLNEAGYACVVVTNQSAIGRGLITVTRLAEIHDRLETRLAEHDRRVDGIYFCPEAPKGKDQRAIEHPDRKPGPGMLLRAARELDLDLTQSWMIGDSLSDVLAGRNAGCRGSILVRTGYGERHASEADAFDFMADDLLSAAKFILDGSSQGNGQATTSSDSKEQGRHA